MSAVPAGDGKLPELIKRLGHADRLERVQVAAEIVRLGRQGQEVVTALLSAVTDERAVVRKMAALVLGDLVLAPEKVVPALVKALGDPDEGVRPGGGGAGPVRAGRQGGGVGPAHGPSG